MLCNYENVTWLSLNGMSYHQGLRYSAVDITDVDRERDNTGHLGFQKLVKSEAPTGQSVVTKRTKEGIAGRCV